jgi:hypothetical protein
MLEAMLLATLLNVSPVLVDKVYRAAGIDGVAVVWCESSFNPKSCRREPDGTSYGLWQLYDKYHAQFREDVEAHIYAGAAFLARCKEKAGGNFVKAVSIYNSGSPTRSQKWGKRVVGVRDALAHYLWFRLR